MAISNLSRMKMFSLVRHLPVGIPLSRNTRAQAASSAAINSRVVFYEHAYRKGQRRASDESVRVVTV